MSYILDALKRAESERERGAVPGLHARQLALAAPDADSSTRNRIWLGLAVVLLLGAGAALWWLGLAPGRDGRPTADQSSIAMAPAPLPTPVAATAAPASVSPVPSPVAVPVADPVTRVLPVPDQTTVRLATNTTGRATAARAVPAAPNSARMARAAPAVPASPGAASATPATPPAAVPLLSELSDDMRRQIPPLTITGAVYSSNPRQRLLLVNNLVLTQGIEVAPELLLEQIGEHNSVFSFRGTRFRLTH